MTAPRLFRRLLVAPALSTLLACDPPPHAEAPPPAGCGPGMVELPAAQGGHFCLDQHVVTVADYQDCVGHAQCSAPAQDKGCRRDDLTTSPEPANCVDYAQADAFCTSRKKRLPTAPELQGTPFASHQPPIHAPSLPEWTASAGPAGQRFTVRDSPSYARQPTFPVAIDEKSRRVDLVFRCAR